MGTDHHDTARLGPPPTAPPDADDLLGETWTWDEHAQPDGAATPAGDDALQQLIAEVCAQLTSRVPPAQAPDSPPHGASPRPPDRITARAPASPRSPDPDPDPDPDPAPDPDAPPPAWADALLASLPPVPPRRAHSVAAQLRQRVEARRASTSRDGMAFRLAASDGR